MFFPLSIELVEKDEDFGDCFVQRRRDAGVEIELDEQFDECFVLMERNSGCSRGCDDPLGRESSAEGRHAGRRITFRGVFERDGGPARVFLLFLRHRHSRAVGEVMLGS